MDVQGFALLSIVLGVPAVAMIPAWQHARRQRSLFAWDFLVPIAPAAIWIYVTSAGIGHQSLANLIELPICIGVAMAASYVRILWVKGRLRNLVVSGLVAALSIYLPFVLRARMPLLPE